MASNLEIVGPMRIQFCSQKTGSAKRINKADVAGFWNANESQTVAHKQGCYVFALRVGRGFTPWYVGQAKKSMKQECFGPHQLHHYNGVLFKGKKGTPVMFFVVLSGKKKVAAKTIADMERFLTQTAFYKNPDLSNVQNTKNLPVWSIKGVLRADRGRPSKQAENIPKTDGDVAAHRP